jgi:tetratricopeptide (TPR) repeat protein
MPVAKKPRAAARPAKAAAPRRAASPTRETALSAAQEMVYEAYEQPTKAKRVACARKALAISPYCADAYVILAQHAATPAEAVHLYTQGVEAGRTALGPHGFDEYEGEFWGFLETRPYMRARAGLAMALLRMGQTDAAMGHLSDMLRLNPNDNQGLRYILLGCLMEKNDLEGARDLLKAYYQDGSPFWTYTGLLWLYRSGETASSKVSAALADALKSNAHVPAMLAGQIPLAESNSGFMTMGGKDEAGNYVTEHGPLWRQTAGAVAWLAALAAAAPKTGSARAKKARA